RPALEPFLDAEREQRQTRRDGPAVDRAHLPAAQLLAGHPGALDRARERLRDVQRQDPLVLFQPAVDLEEVARRRLRGGRQLGGAPETLVELLRAELGVVAEALGAEAHVQRNDPPVREAPRALRVVRGRVEHDCGVRRRQLHQPVAAVPAAPRTASTISSSGRSFPRQATAPASSSASTSRAPAAAVSATTATPGACSRTSRVTWTPSRPGSR